MSSERHATSRAASTDSSAAAARAKAIPGSSKFYVSFEDSLMRLFTSPRITAFLQRFRPPEGEPISANILNKSIETAQKRIEQRNYIDAQAYAGI